MKFNFRMPTRIFFGQHCVTEHSGDMAVLGKRALIVTGGSSSKKNGSLDDVISALNKEGISYEIFDQVEQNPSLNTVYQGGGQARKLQADFIIGIGGGSPLDAAKAVAILAVNDITPEELMAKNWVKDPLPVVAVPTTAGTGSEVTPYAVLTVDWAETKLTITGEKLFPVVSYLDGRYMLGLPWQVTVNTAVDALSHSIEGYLTKRATVITDLLALESIGTIGRLLRTMDPQHITISQREELLYGSLLAGMVIAQTTTTFVHGLGYPLTYYKGLPHGLANGILLKSSLAFIARAVPERVQRVIEALGCGDLQEVGELLQRVLTPVQLKLTAEELAFYAAKAMRSKNLANCFQPPSAEDLQWILADSGLV
ncbi:iron-containing alcohol dehydrogenase family protein [Desulforamulus ferrireducens]|uniref:Alcohol dehydrogenase n=1 Tax=Desulforamulus ferrireducens TaxID=1833852 RepID=A0A1S6IZ29_9FIRM|nr:iron-containing alcohol dehydrogenase family protein [Desulforamulus ferrireducens]AQS60023.1 alcohol dehydrogenase [Desulforamulus ferrireducens]